VSAVASIHGLSHHPESKVRFTFSLQSCLSAWTLVTIYNILAFTLKAKLDLLSVYKVACPHGPLSLYTIFWLVRDNR